MGRIADRQRQFLALQPAMGEHVRDFLGAAGHELDIVTRDDGAYWFILGARHVRVTLTVLGELVMSVHDADGEQGVKPKPGVLAADPKILAATIALLLVPSPAPVCKHENGEQVGDDLHTWPGGYSVDIRCVDCGAVLYREQHAEEATD